MVTLLAFLALIGSTGAPPKHPARAVGPKVLVYYDMEGISGIKAARQVLYPQPEYQAARHFLTGDLNAAIAGLKAGGAGEIVVTDAHGSGNDTGPDVLLNLLDKRATFLWKDHPFDPYMDSPDSSFQAIICIGMHARAGTDGFMAHTVTVEPAYRVNGRLITETSIVAYSAGRFGIPVIMVSGDNILRDQIKDEFPAVEYATVKTARGRAHADVLPEATAWAAIRKAAQAAIENLPQMKPVPVASSYRFEVSYLNKLEADLAAGAASQSERVDSLTIGYTTPDFVSGYNRSNQMTQAAGLERLRLMAQAAMASPSAASIRADFLMRVLQTWLEPEKTPKPKAPPASAAKKRYHGDS